MEVARPNPGSAPDGENGYEEYDENISTSLQLRHELRESVTRALSTRRPVITHLNADTTWLLSIPYPRKAPNHKIRKYFHILIDPWLQGSQSDVAKFFSQQWHNEGSSVKTIAGVEESIRGIERAALGNDDNEMNDDNMDDSESLIDAVVVSHEFTDHMHKETLLEIPSSVLVLASTKAASKIQSWNHFGLVVEIPIFEGHWARPRMDHLPSWLGITRLAYAGRDLLYYHSAVMISFSPHQNANAEAIIYTPHGVSPRDVKVLEDVTPKIRTLALLHGLHDIKLPAGGQLNLGAHNGLKVQRLLGAKYWIGTHDEVKKGGGLVSWFLNRQVISLEDAIEMEREQNGEEINGTGLESMADVHFEELGNGESMILQ